MSHAPLLASATVLLLALLAGTARAESCMPPATIDAHRSWVAQDVTVDGLMLSIQQFESPRPAAALLGQFSAWAQREGLPLKRYDAAGAPAVAALAGDCLYTLQIEHDGANAGMTTGYLSGGRPGKPSNLLGRMQDFPSFPGARTLSDLASRDGPQLGRTLAQQASATPAEVADYYRRTLEGEGWRFSIAHEQRRADGHTAYLLGASRKGVRADLVITAAHQGSQVTTTLNDRE